MGVDSNHGGSVEGQCTKEEKFGFSWKHLKNELFFLVRYSPAKTGGGNFFKKSMLRRMTARMTRKDYLETFVSVNFLLIQKSTSNGIMHK